MEWVCNNIRVNNSPKYICNSVTIVKNDGYYIVKLVLKPYVNIMVKDNIYSDFLYYSELKDANSAFYCYLGKKKSDYFKDISLYIDLKEIRLCSTIITHTNWICDDDGSTQLEITLRCEQWLELSDLNSNINYIEHNKSDVPTVYLKPKPLKEITVNFTLINSLEEDMLI